MATNDSGPAPPVAGHPHDYPPCPDSTDRRFAHDDPRIWDLFVRYHRTRDRAVRNQLIEEHIPMAENLARRYTRRGEPFDDLRQVALVGLLKAVEGFDPRRGAPFGPFAVPTIRGELRRHFRDRGWSIKVPRRLQELHLELDTIASRVGHELGRAPTLAEIAAAADVSVESVLEAMEAADMYRPRSIDGPTVSGAPGASELIGAPDPDLATADTRLAVRRLLERLSDRDRRIVYLRFFEDRTQTEIADEMGISQMHVSRLLARSLRVLQDVGDPSDEANDGPIGPSR
ncbi:MAG: SigB/SigF/SigG family RNA polymerase sigma factor [Acidimicrobiia bacterium]